jgi:hypothetical protein
MLTSYQQTLLNDVGAPDGYGTPMPVGRGSSSFLVLLQDRAG